MYINFFIILLLIKNTFLYLILPLNKIIYNNIDSIKDPKEVIQKLYNSEIYTTIEIGLERTPIKTFLSYDRTELIISGKNVKNHKYNESSSTTYICVNNITKEFYFGQFSEVLLSKEDFFIKNETGNFQHIEQLKFILGTKASSSDPYEGVMGLQLSYLNSEPEYNLVNSLKSKKIINSYNWFLNFDNMDKSNGKMYIGTLPHMIDNRYEENNLKTALSAKNGVNMNWGMEFSETKYGESKKLKKSYQAYIHFDFGLFQGPNELMEIIDSEFFDYYIKEKICFKDVYGIQKDIFYYCKNVKEFDITKFKSIYLKNIELEYVFEFNYKDLFLYSNDTIYFLMVFREVDLNNFFIGEPFLKKYNLVFNQESKKIGYYTYVKEEEEEKEKEIEKKDSNNKYFSLINILLVLILICLLAILIMIYFKKTKRKIRTNELEDYDYVAKNDLITEEKIN